MNKNIESHGDSKKEKDDNEKEGDKQLKINNLKRNECLLVTLGHEEEKENSDDEDDYILRGDMTWHTEHLANEMIVRLEHTIKDTGNDNVITRTPAQIEAHIFAKALSQSDYFNCITRVLIHLQKNPAHRRPLAQLDRDDIYLGMWMRKLNV